MAGQAPALAPFEAEREKSRFSAAAQSCASKSRVETMDFDPKFFAFGMVGQEIYGLKQISTWRRQSASGAERETATKG